MHLAQLNIARLRQPLDHPASRGFVDGLAPINELAEKSPGFVWRLIGDGTDATSFRPHPDPNVIVNLSVWQSHESLHDFVFRSAHTEFLRRRSEWFGQMDEASRVAWWVPVGHVPDIPEAFGRLAFINQHGSSPYGFALTRPTEALMIDRVGLTDANAQQLIQALNTDLLDRYPEPGSTFFSLDPQQVSGDRGQFLVARLNGEAVACGAFRVLEEQPGTAEIKRMFVRPQARGLKLGAAVLAELERRAAAAGVHRLVLETGVRQVEAATVYTRAGYQPCPCWGGYADAPLSRCYEKQLAIELGE